MKRLAAALIALAMFVGMTSQSAFAAQTTGAKLDLTQYLSEISNERGFEVTVDDINKNLAAYGASLDQFASVDELKDLLGEVIKVDLSNLSTIYETYGLDEASLNRLLEENGEELNDYIFLDILDWSVMFYTEDFGTDTDFSQMLAGMFSQFGVSDKELQNIAEYFATMEEYFSDPAVMQRLTKVSERMVSFIGNIEASEELSEDMLAELLNIYDELFSVLKIKATFAIVRNGVETPVNLTELASLDNISDAAFKIYLYGENSQLLADFTFDGQGLADAGDSSSDAGNVINGKGKSKGGQNKPTDKTVKGGKLPKTATGFIPSVLFGLAIITAGIILSRKVRTVKLDNKN